MPSRTVRSACLMLILAVSAAGAYLATAAGDPALAAPKKGERTFDGAALYETLRRACRMAMENGVRFAYTGNVRDEAGGSTWCARCRTRLIGRDGYELTEWNLDGRARCVQCGATCPGVFDSRPGRWGARRHPVRLADFAA